MRKGCLGIELDAFLGKSESRNGEAAFLLQDHGLKGTGPASLRVELDIAVRRSGPYHSRSSAATADRLFRRHCQSNSACQ
jgi:hypothetical protein